MFLYSATHVSILALLIMVMHVKIKEMVSSQNTSYSLEVDTTINYM